MVFPADDLLSEWTATLALAFNDLSLVHARMEEDHGTPHKYFYWLRLAIAHFYEGAKFLDETSTIPEVAAFVAQLSPEARGQFEACMSRYRERATPTFRLRNQVAFHYPRLAPGRTNRPVRKVLESLAPEIGQFDSGGTGKIRDARMLFADDVTSEFFVQASGGHEALAAVHSDIEAGIGSFMKFTNAALDAWFFQAQERGAKFFNFEEGPFPWPQMNEPD
jgi:hypothetical protein